MGWQNEYWRWSRPSLGKKRRVLRNSRPCGQDCKHTDPVGFWPTWAICWLNWAPPSPAQSAVKGMSSTQRASLPSAYAKIFFFFFIIFCNLFQHFLKFCNHVIMSFYCATILQRIQTSLYCLILAQMRLGVICLLLIYPHLYVTFVTLCLQLY